MIETITKAYDKLEEELRALYVEGVMGKEGLVCLGMSDLVRGRYEKVVGERFRWVKERLIAGFYGYKKER